MRISRLAPLVLGLLLAGCGVSSALPPSSSDATESPLVSPSESPSDSPLVAVTDATTALERWQRTGPDSYRFTIRYDCFCATFGSWRVVVRDGQVVRARPLDDQNLGGELNRYVVSIDELLKDAIRAESGEAGSIEATYDPDTGIPTKVYIDWITNAIDDEIGWQIRDFSPR